MLQVGVFYILFNTCQTIRVDFGTNKGPIQPATSTQKTQYYEPRSSYSNPAPVFENALNDIPNPRPYHPYTPFQYRSKIHSSFEKAPASIYFGSDYDQKYAKQLPYQTLRKIAKYNALAAANRGNPNSEKSTISQRSLDSSESQPSEPQRRDTIVVIPNASSGVNYRGPQTFGADHFEPRRNVQFFGNFKQNGNLDRRIVPEFGVLYSAGVRYYIPRLDDVTYGDNLDQGDSNSVYDRHDIKH